MPFGILCIAVIVRSFHERIELHPHRVDYAGSLLLAAGAGTVMFVLVMLGELSATSAIVLAAIGVLLIAALIAHELRTAEPMLPVRLYIVRIIALANVANVAMGAMSMGITAFLPTYVQGAMGLSAVLAGATLGVTSLSWTIGALIGSRLLAHVTYRATAIAGAAMLVAGSAFLITLEPARGIWWALAGGTVLGLGFGFVNLVFTLTTQSAVGWEQRGAATASNQFMRQIGASVGTAAFGAVFNLGLYARVPDAGDVIARMMDPAKRSGLAPLDVERFAAGIAASLHDIYVVLGLIGVVILIIALTVPAALSTSDPAPA